ncbi:MAG: carbon monoxide dehydrogenase subunit G [Acidobacteria bacterium]|nr:carbon monoxide dehydrogenase subunit G [Acidobacteriota bacterium]
MKIDANHAFDTDRNRLWNLLMDPAFLKKSMPGCEELREVEPDKYEAVMRVGVGSVKGTYRGRVEIAEKDPLSSYKLQAEGSGAAGFVKGGATIHLADQGDGKTVMSLRGEAQVGGPVARVGQRLLDAVSRWMVNEFFKQIEKEIKS